MSASLSSFDVAGRTVGEIAAAVPGATIVFRKFNIDFCCQGDVALEDAVRVAGIDATELFDALHDLEKTGASVPSSLSTDELVDHIIRRYHETHSRELPELVELATKVEAVHAAHPMVPKGLAALLQRMLEELSVHMKKEELVLFPAMRRGFEGLDMPISQMRHEHDDHGAHIRQLQAMTHDFVPPSGACRSWQALYTGAAKLADDLIEHVHLENNVLFPRFECAPAGE